MSYPVQVGSTFRFQGTTINYKVLNIASRDTQVQAHCEYQSTQSGLIKQKWFKMSQIEKTFSKNPVILNY
jgi:urease beta subunit